MYGTDRFVAQKQQTTTASRGADDTQIALEMREIKGWNAFGRGRKSSPPKGAANPDKWANLRDPFTPEREPIRS